MRIPALIILTVSAVLMAAAARAQTYDPRYPVCMQSYAIGGSTIKCSYTTLAKCNTSAQGLGGSCMNNPYFSGTQTPPGLRYPR